MTADGTNANLIGASTRLQSPLPSMQMTFGNVVVLEVLIFGIIALGV